MISMVEASAVEDRIIHVRMDSHADIMVRDPTRRDMIPRVVHPRVDPIVEEAEDVVEEEAGGTSDAGITTAGMKIVRMKTMRITAKKILDSLLNLQQSHLVIVEKTRIR